MKTITLVFMILMFAAAAPAQQPWAEEKDDQQQRAVTNEDGGRSYLILPASGALVGLLKPGATSLADLEQHSIFVGSAWADPSLRARESRLGKLLSTIRDHAQGDEVTAAGIKNFFAPTWIVDRSDMAGNRNISDLEIQSILSDALRDGPKPNGESMYVVYLDPTIHSTLGPLVAEKHYLAYHGFLNFSGMKIHYVVVPFQSDVEAGYQIALRAFIVAALHSEDTAN